MRDNKLAFYRIEKIPSPITIVIYEGDFFFFYYELRLQFDRYNCN